MTWIERGDIITFIKQDPHNDPFMLMSPYLVAGVAQFTHGIIDMALVDCAGQYTPMLTTNLRYIKKLQGN